MTRQRVAAAILASMATMTLAAAIAMAGTETSRVGPLVTENGAFGTPVIRKAVRSVFVSLTSDIPQPGGTLRRETMRVELAPGTTVGDALARAWRVERGFVCSAPDDIYALAGVAYDPRAGTAWTIEVNGNTKDVSARTRLSDGDRVHLRYGAYTDALHRKLVQ